MFHVLLFRSYLTLLVRMTCPVKCSMFKMRSHLHLLKITFQEHLMITTSRVIQLFMLFGVHQWMHTWVTLLFIVSETILGVHSFFSSFFFLNIFFILNIGPYVQESQDKQNEASIQVNSGEAHFTSSFSNQSLASSSSEPVTSMPLNDCHSPTPPNWSPAPSPPNWSPAPSTSHTYHQWSPERFLTTQPSSVTTDNCEIISDQYVMLYFKGI